MDMYDRIRNRRKELKMTQDELAKLTGYNDRSSIAKIEAKKADLSQSKIIAFAKALNVTTSYLMDGEEQVKKYSGNSVIGERIRNRRKELKMSQEELANLAGYTDRSTISRIEKGLIDLTESKISTIAQALKVTPQYLVGWTEEKTQQPLKEKSNAIFLGDDSTFIYIPLYESISAGYGSEESEFIEMIPLYGLRKNGNDYFAVKVRGYSMEPKISDSSIIIIKKDVTIENGEIGAFYLNGETFVKQKRIGNGKIILHSFNNAFSDIVINEYDDFKEYGKVVGDYNLY